MATTTRKNLEALLKRVRDTPDFEVADLGMRWRVTNRTGFSPIYIPKRPPQSNTLKPFYDLLAGIGWQEFNAAEVAEEDRQARLEADRQRNEARMQEAVERAARAQERLAAAAVLADDAKPVKGGDFREEVVEVDYTYAEELLKLNEYFRDNRVGTGTHTNRPISQRTINKYAAQMLRREFPLTHQGIAFNIEGELVDGQQRLMALIKAATTGVTWAGVTYPADLSVTFRTKITWDLPVDVMRYVDIGRNRSRTDLLALEGEVNRYLLATALNLIWLFYHVKPEDWFNANMAPDEMFSVLAEHPDIRKAVASAQQAGAYKVVSASSISAFIYVAGRVYRDAPIRDFLHGLGTGENLPPGDPRIALRNLMERIHRNKRSKINNIEQFMLLLKCWNYWLMGRPLKEIAIKSGEAFPWPIERD